MVYHEARGGVAIVGAHLFLEVRKEGGTQWTSSETTHSYAINTCVRFISELWVSSDKTVNIINIKIVKESRAIKQVCDSIIIKWYQKNHNKVISKEILDWVLLFYEVEQSLVNYLSNIALFFGFCLELPEHECCMDIVMF